MSEDLRAKEIFKLNPSLYDQVQAKIEDIQNRLKGAKEDVKIKDREIWFLEALLNQKDTEEVEQE